MTTGDTLTIAQASGSDSTKSDMPEPKIKYTSSSEIIASFCFEFRPKNKIKPVSKNKIKQFCKKIEENEIKFGSNFEIDNIEQNKTIRTNISFREGFVESDRFPSMINISKEGSVEKNPTIGGSQPDDTASKKENNQSPTDDSEIRLLLTQYGVGVVQIHKKEFLDSDSDYNDYINKVEFSRNINQDRDSMSKKLQFLSKRIWGNFVQSWRDKMDQNVTVKKDYKDYEIQDKYVSTYIKNPSILYDSEEYTISDVYNPSSDLADDVKIEIKKKIIGLLNTSTAWREYSVEYVNQVFRKEISATTNEVQLISSKHGLFIRDEYGMSKETNFETEYNNYFADMVLAIDLYIIMRSSMRIIDEKINEEMDQLFTEENTVFEKYNPVRAVRVIGYEENIREYDEWIAEIKEWKYISRHGKIQHFHRFLSTGYDNLHIDQWLDETEESVNHLRRAYGSRSDRISTISNIVLTIAIASFSLILVVNNFI